MLRRNKKRSPEPNSARLSDCPCCGRDTTVGRAAEKREWQREAEQYRPHPMPTIYSTNVCTCPDVYALTVGPRQPCPVHTHLWNGVTTTNTIGVTA